MQKVQPSHTTNDASDEPAARATAAPRPDSDFRSWFNRSRAEVDRALASYMGELKNRIPPHSRLADAVLYSVQVGGKRLRPVLVLESCRTCGGTAEAAVPMAIAVEFVHTFSLIHDDLPAMDDDDLRRGQPTNHKVFGEGMALLAGDWLLAHAFALLTSDRVPAALAPGLTRTLTDATQRLMEGQGADLDGGEREPDAELVEYIHTHKTAALIEACCRLGAQSAGASGDAVAALARFGHHLGLAFQITDDVLDATGTVESLGKRVGKDAAQAKQTYPAACGLDLSQRRASEEIEAAVHALDSFGGQADHLRALARYVGTRSN